MFSPCYFPNISSKYFFSSSHIDSLSTIFFILISLSLLLPHAFHSMLPITSCSSFFTQASSHPGSSEGKSHHLGQNQDTNIDKLRVYGNHIPPKPSSFETNTKYHFSHLKNAFDLFFDLGLIFFFRHFLRLLWGSLLLPLPKMRYHHWLDKICLPSIFLNQIK